MRISSRGTLTWAVGKSELLSPFIGSQPSLLQTTVTHTGRFLCSDVVTSRDSFRAAIKAVWCQRWYISAGVHWIICTSKLKPYGAFVQIRLFMCLTPRNGVSFLAVTFTSLNKSLWLHSLAVFRSMLKVAPKKAFFFPSLIPFQHIIGLFSKLFMYFISVNKHFLENHVPENVNIWLYAEDRNCFAC